MAAKEVKLIHKILAIVGIIAAFYHVFDLGTTTNNCLGDLAGTIFVSKLEEKAKKI